MTTSATLHPPDSSIDRRLALAGGQCGVMPYRPTRSAGGVLCRIRRAGRRAARGRPVAAGTQRLHRRRWHEHAGDVDGRRGSLKWRSAPDRRSLSVSGGARCRGVVRSCSRQTRRSGGRRSARTRRSVLPHSRRPSWRGSCCRGTPSTLFVPSPRAPPVRSIAIVVDAADIAEVQAAAERGRGFAAATKLSR